MQSIIESVYISTIAHCLSLKELEFLELGIIGVDKNGGILFVEDATHFASTEEIISFVMEKYNPENVYDYSKLMLIPGFIDGHAHAPQYEFTGTAMNLPLLDWLSKYTFPTESKYSNSEYAKTMYTHAVSAHLKNGTTTCSYFATIHTPACKALVEVIQSLGQRGYVGKVNMDRNCPDFYIEESSNVSLADTKSFIEYCQNLNDPLITPVITPRFVPTCSSELLHGLGALSKKYNVPVQSHMSENLGEIEWVKSLHPECSTYLGVYENAGLLHTEKAYMAHCCLSNEEERKALSRTKCGVVHCPTSNFDLVSGVLNVRKMVEEGVKVGLGTDVSGGYSPSMLVALRHAIIASQMVEMNDKKCKALTWKEAFYFATLGGSEVLSLSNVCGNFVKGKKFDALLINLQDNLENNPLKIFSHDAKIDHLQKFLYLGDDRNIQSVFVNGKKVI